MESIKILKLQSADVLDTARTVETSEVVTFDGESGDIEDYGYQANPIASANATENTSLAKFLSRPTLIDTRTWATSDLNGYLGSNLEPWHLFLNNSIIKNKLTNYAFLRAKLCMKIVLNATPFHYGCLRVAYEPNVNAANTGDRLSKIRSNAISLNPLITPLSQLPGAWLYPADNAGGEIHVPFFKTTDWLKLNVKEPAKTMGALYYYIAFPLSLARTSASTVVTMDTYAWLEDVELGGSTAELTLQAKDEYDGPISKPASALAKIAGRLTDIPVIGRFARATTIGASAVAGIASIFGFTNTPIIDGIPARIPMPGPQVASAEISAPIQKLTLDPKQELSVDPTLHGLSSMDEMVIQNIISKESTLVMDGWSTTDAVGTVIFNANVGPCLFNRIELDDAFGVLKARRVYHTPLSYLGMMFSHWRGDIIFEVDVICTKFHKGRLKVSWDPLGSGGAAALPENVVYTTILDIGVNNKATFRVPFHQAFAWMRTRGISRNNWSAGNALPVDDRFDNGLFLISVLNPLISPVSPQNIGVKISVYAAENFEFANPKNYLGESSNTPPPTFFAVQGKDEIDVEASDVAFGDTGSQHPQRFAQNFGQSVVSLRNVLHRMSIYDVSYPGDSAVVGVVPFVKSYSRLPPMYGFDPNGLSTANKIVTAGTAPFNYVPTHPLTYVAMMYGAFRGGVNYTANLAVDMNADTGDIRVNRYTDTANAANRRGRLLAGANFGASQNTIIRLLNNGASAGSAGTAGAAFTNSCVNGAISWNAPMMTGTNWNYSDPTYAIPGNVNDQTQWSSTQLEILFRQTAINQTTRVANVVTYAGSGVDFTCLWWLCCPTLDYYIGDPTAT
jgi:hypothetical protein